MKKKSVIVVLIVVMVLAASSCTTFKLSGAQVTTNIPAYVSVGEFQTTVTVWEFLGAPGGGNLLNVTADAMDSQIYDAIQREIQKFTGDAAVNVTVEYKASFMNILISGITGTILSPCEAHISGTIIKYQ